MKERPSHVAMILDGNGRWAARRGLPRTAGHRAGARAVRPVVEAAAEAGVEALTLYAFSADNWKRPLPEVTGVMRLLAAYLGEEGARCAAAGVRLQVIGRRDRLRAPLLRAIEEAEDRASGGSGMLLRIAIDYSARHALAEAALRAIGAATADPPTTGPPTVEPESLAHAIAAAHGTPEVREVDLLIRTGGERRLSDFLLWECAYAELHFTSALWPDFTPAALRSALEEYAGRERRFGGVPVPSRAVPTHR